ncbi:hypothetical protein D3C85_1915850 [compost metagenome]
MLIANCAPLAAAEPIFQLARGHGSRERVALQEVAADLAEYAGLLHRFDPFSNNLDAKRATYVDDGRH